ncbi:MAG: SGNH/GDSL hydrolase family protein [Bacillales bacterium]|jgi:lysophospholipase L1-like esterase|nr:SGNH/GDSL hydrolase family protein [Bacillales bacterium]
MKKCLLISLLFLLLGCNTPSSQEPSLLSSDITENELKINTVVLYLNYSAMPINKLVNGVLSSVDLYYEIENESIAFIENDLAYPLLVGSTDVYASMQDGTETSFKINVRQEQEFKFNVDVHTRVEQFGLNGVQDSPTLFWGDSFFDPNVFWRDFYTDFEDLNCFTAGVSSSKASDWMFMRDRLIINYHPKNIVIHIGTNDVNDSAYLSINQYYDIITTTLDFIRLALPESNIYYLGIENRVNEAGAKNQYTTLVTEKIRDEYVFANFHYIDTPSIFNVNQSKYMSGDNVHPSREGYLYYVETLKGLITF